MPGLVESGLLPLSHLREWSEPATAFGASIDLGAFHVAQVDVAHLINCQASADGEVAGFFSGRIVPSPSLVNYREAFKLCRANNSDFCDIKERASLGRGSALKLSTPNVRVLLLLVVIPLRKAIREVRVFFPVFWQ